MPLLAGDSNSHLTSSSSFALLQFTVRNACPFTIWYVSPLSPSPLPPSVVSHSHRSLLRPAVFTDLNVGSAVPNVETGWEGKGFLASPSLVHVQRLNTLPSPLPSHEQHRHKPRRLLRFQTTGKPDAFGDVAIAISQRTQAPIPA